MIREILHYSRSESGIKSMHIGQAGLAQLVIATLLLAAAMPSKAASISFTAIDLSDTAAGQDLWQYTYAASWASFPEFAFFDIYFAPATYLSLAAGPAPNSDWDVVILQQPNPANLQPFDRGILDSFALVANPSLAGVFSVSFVYLGAGNPGPQAFDIFDQNATLVQSGLTSPAVTSTVPEPTSQMTALIALIAAAARLLYRRRGESTKRTI